MAAFVEPLLVEDLPADLEKTHRILDDMIIKGSLIACQRKAELEQLDTMLENLRMRGPSIFPQSKPLEDATPIDAAVNASSLQGAIDIPALQLGGDSLELTLQPFEEWTWEDALNSEQLRNVADLLDGDQYIGSSEFMF